jgi:hypothetical protein
MIINWSGPFSAVYADDDNIFRFEPLVLSKAIEESIELISLSSLSVSENGELVEQLSLSNTSRISAEAGRDITEVISLINSTSFSLAETMEMLSEFGIVTISEWSLETQQDILELLNFVFSPDFSIEGAIGLKEAKGIGVSLQFIKIEHSAEFRNQDLSFDFKVSNK